MGAVFACRHLQPFVDEMTSDGAAVVLTETTWSNARAVLVLSRGPTIAAARNRWTLPDKVKLWWNDDGHYSLENGIICAQCAMSVSWPRPERLSASP